MIFCTNKRYQGSVVFDIVNDLIDEHYELRFLREFPKTKWRRIYSIMEDEELTGQLKTYRRQKIKQEVKRVFIQNLINQDSTG